MSRSKRTNTVIITLLLLFVRINDLLHYYDVRQEEQIISPDVLSPSTYDIPESTYFSLYHFSMISLFIYLFELSCLIIIIEHISFASLKTLTRLNTHYSREKQARLFRISLLKEFF